MGSRKLKYAGDILLRFLHTPGGQDSTSSRPRSRSKQRESNIERKEAESVDNAKEESLQRDSEKEASTVTLVCILFSFLKSYCDAVNVLSLLHEIFVTYTDVT